MKKMMMILSLTSCMSNFGIPTIICSDWRHTQVVTTQLKNIEDNVKILLWAKIHKIENDVKRSLQEHKNELKAWPSLGHLYATIYSEKEYLKEFPIYEYTFQHKFFLSDDMISVLDDAYRRHHMIYFNNKVIDASKKCKNMLQRGDTITITMKDPNNHPVVTIVINSEEMQITTRVGCEKLLTTTVKF